MVKIKSIDQEGWVGELDWDIIKLYQDTAITPKTIPYFIIVSNYGPDVFKKQTYLEISHLFLWMQGCRNFGLKYELEYEFSLFRDETKCFFPEIRLKVALGDKKWERVEDKPKKSLDDVDVYVIIKEDHKNELTKRKIYPVVYFHNNGIISLINDLGQTKQYHLDLIEGTTRKEDYLKQKNKKLVDPWEGVRFAESKYNGLICPIVLHLGENHFTLKINDRHYNHSKEDYLPSTEEVFLGQNKPHDSWEGVEFFWFHGNGTVHKLDHYTDNAIVSPDGKMFPIKSCSPATELEFVHYLKKTFKEKFGEVKVGDEFEVPSGGRNIIYAGGNEEFEYFKKYDQFFYHNTEFYYKGKWAEKIEKVEVEWLDWNFTFGIGVNVDFTFRMSNIDLIKSKNKEDLGNYLSKCLKDYLLNYK